HPQQIRAAPRRFSVPDPRRWIALRLPHSPKNVSDLQSGYTPPGSAANRLHEPMPWFRVACMAASASDGCEQDGEDRNKERRKVPLLRGHHQAAPLTAV